MNTGKLIFKRRSLIEASVRLKNGRFVSNTEYGKDTKTMVIADASDFPIAAHIESASPYELKLIEKTVDKRFLKKTADPLMAKEWVQDIFCKGRVDQIESQTFKGTKRV